ncbi:MAG TPA: hypothetical protein VN668_05910 [Stellaceae bacterium]|nr:hypothetical protein [Stellaceae bacterium]
MRSRSVTALSLATLGLLAGMALAAPARAETLVVYCTDHDQVHPYPPQTFYIDLSAATVHYDDGDTSRYTVHAQVTEQQIKWNWGTNYFGLDRYSGTLNRAVDGRYFTSWDCRRVQKRAIE